MVLRPTASSTSNGARTISQGSGTANFELRLYEGQSRFDVIYSTVTNGNTSATAGVQKNDTAFDQYFCNGSGNAGYWRAKLHPAKLRESADGQQRRFAPEPRSTGQFRYQSAAEWRPWY